MNKKHENYKELIWTLAKTDFKLRYHGSVLGYIWVLLKPLCIFAVLNFVFSTMFSESGTYSLELLVGLMIYFFFTEGTSAGMASLMSKAQLVTKIYVPRWAIILASTINATMIFLMNLIVIAFFFAIKGFLPSLTSVLVFLVFSVFLYIIILSFSLITAPLFVRFRDLSMIWEVLLMVLMYASPIIYPLSALPAKYHIILLLNPLAFIVHYTKEALIHNHFAISPQYVFVFFATVVAGFALGIFSYRKLIPKVAENI
ncbi:MAG TPA: ABC transporter permease [Candidatus Moranbacteria bacterium]|nr:ABC transporter permease [Candidatus Moranbacteria bacterium]